MKSKREKKLTEAAAELGSLKARVRELEEGLEPFAKEADTHHRAIPNHMFIDDYEGPGVKTGITVGDLRRARALLNPERWSYDTTNAAYHPSFLKPAKDN